MTTTERPRLLLAGSGSRVRNNFGPALAVLGEHLDVMGLWSRTPEHALRAASPWGITVVDDLEEASAKADVVILSVSIEAVPNMLERLRASASGQTLVIDTPTIAPRQLHALGSFAPFERVIVAEDYMNFPQWALARTAVAGGLIGELERIELRHSGHRAHALALIRSFTGFLSFRSARRNTDGATLVHEFRVDRHLTGAVVEPYDKTIGTTVVTGSSGIITDDPTLEARRPVHRLRRLGPDDAPTGFELGGFEVSLPHLPELLHSPGADNSLFNGLKSCGLMTVLASTWETNINAGYGYRQGAYDNLVATLVRRRGRIGDTMVPFSRLGLLGALDGVSRLRPGH